MPRRDRSHSAVAAVDVALADLAASRNLDLSPGRISAWRLSGLLPVPTVPQPRPPGAPPGVHALGYSPKDWQHATAALSYLAEHAGRGRRHSALAVRMYAAGVPVPHGTVVAALRDELSRAQAIITRETQLDNASTGVTAGEDSWGLPPEFDRAEKLAARDATKTRGLTAAIRRQLRRSGTSAAGNEVTVVVALIQTLLGVAPDATDEVALDRMLTAYGAHGLVEPLVPGGPVVVPDGPTALREALAFHAGERAFFVPDDITADELDAARSFLLMLTTGLRNAPPELRHHLGGEAMLNAWQPTDAMLAAQILVGMVKVMRLPDVDVRPIVDAMREVGLLIADNA